ncbi:hypothetical protein [Pseudonocardia humida]|uniref:Uncharacterized protein n=1 Tax=Pseudonocardia humida TaxID=2800819 RepID=A0ABT0ZYJ4_9PSEU|nr:hypothetical protein [Pseudonocardia humida]MCO1655684.1 hypothetical protein [Pseudonocardia humida]
MSDPRAELGDVAGMGELVRTAPGLMSAIDVVASALTAWRAGRTLHIPGATTSAMTAVLARLARALTRRAMERAFRG